MHVIPTKKMYEDFSEDCQNVMTIKGNIEWFRKVLGVIAKPLFETEVLGYTQLFQNELLHVDPHILPDSRPWTHSKSNPRWRYYGFLHSHKLTT